MGWSAPLNGPRGSAQRPGPAAHLSHSRGNHGNRGGAVVHGLPLPKVHCSLLGVLARALALPTSLPARPPGTQDSHHPQGGGPGSREKGSVFWDFPLVAALSFQPLFSLKSGSLALSADSGTRHPREPWATSGRREQGQIVLPC